MTTNPQAPRQMSPRVLYALGALAALLFGYDNGIIAAAILFIPDEIVLSPVTEGLVVSGTVAGPCSARSPPDRWPTAAVETARCSWRAWSSSSGPRGPRSPAGS